MMRVRIEPDEIEVLVRQHLEERFDAKVEQLEFTRSRVGGVWAEAWIEFNPKKKDES